MTRPRVVLCPGADDLRAAAAPLDRAGWSVHDGFDLPDEPWDFGPRRWACVGVVATEADGEQAVWALARGCALVLSLAEDLAPEIGADLERAGTVELFDPAPPDRGPLSDDEASLLDALASGMSVRQAAAELYLSNRTAQRRLASARTALGVRTTREAVLTWTRRGRTSR